MTSGKRKAVNLALQGGGAHGAFTWGVLDYLLEEGSLDISAVSGTSAGAMNAVAMASGFVEDGRDGARAALSSFWKKMSDAAMWGPIRREPIDVFMGNWSFDNSFSYQVLDAFSHMVSPYKFNPLNINPLMDVLMETVDFDRVRACSDMDLFISATNVETGRVRVFERDVLTPEMVMASACLPHLYQAVEIDGVPYWDGGYMGNPALFPFHDSTACSDIVIVQINPVERKGVPTSAREIQNRINEISFNASLLKELRSIDFVARLIEEGKLSPNQYRQQRLHLIENQNELSPLGASSKMNAEWAFLEPLRDVGRATAESWLKANFESIGERQTVNVRALFQGADD